MDPSSFQFSPHRDILEAPVPSDEAGQLRLLEECKTRGRSAVQASAWPDALFLYQKALECANNDTKQQAILHSNVSLAAGKMNQWVEKALPAAVKATECDATYVKGWWRKSQAQAAVKDFSSAIKSMEVALKLEPENKALQKELTKLQKLEKQAQDPTQNTTNSTKASGKPKNTPAPPRSVMTAASTNSAATTKNTENTMQVEGTEFTKSDHVKGYKIVNGKKTSYFHNELSEEAKALIGDIQPTKLENPTTTTQTVNKDTATSAWNTAGTWEEKDCTGWAKTSLEEQLKNTVYQQDETQVTVEKASVTGSASVATVRGKRRYIYEFSLAVEWKLETAADTVTGKLEFPDVDGTCVVGEPYEATNFKVTTPVSCEESVRSLSEKLVYKGGLRDALHQSIDAWVRLFQETYG